MLQKQILQIYIKLLDFKYLKTLKVLNTSNLICFFKIILKILYNLIKKH